MTFFRILPFLLLLPLLLVGKLLFGRRKDMVFLPEEHPEMAKAIAEARATLPDFRRALAAPGPGMSDFSLKVRFDAEGGGHEHCWVSELQPRDSGFTGKLANDPNSLPTLKLGSVVEVSEDRITDWSYLRGNVYVGHHTTRALLPHMSKKVRSETEKILGWIATDAS